MSISKAELVKLIQSQGSDPIEIRPFLRYVGQTNWDAACALLGVMWQADQLTGDETKDPVKTMRWLWELEKTTNDQLLDAMAKENIELRERLAKAGERITVLERGHSDKEKDLLMKLHDTRQELEELRKQYEGKIATAEQAVRKKDSEICEIAECFGAVAKRVGGFDSDGFQRLLDEKRYDELIELMRQLASGCC